MNTYLHLTGVFGLFWIFMPLQMSVLKILAHGGSMVLQNYQNFIEMTSNMIYIVAFGGGLKCLHEIHSNTQCPLPLVPHWLFALYKKGIWRGLSVNRSKFGHEDFKFHVQNSSVPCFSSLLSLQESWNITTKAIVIISNEKWAFHSVPTLFSHFLPKGKLF